MIQNITKEKLQDIGTHILNGMTEREACILADVSYNELQLMKEGNDIVRQFIEKSHIQFKEAHLKEIQKNKSEKNSMWLLEKLRPEEFGSRARSSEGPTINIISQIIKEIQNDTQPIITISRGSKSTGEEESDKNDLTPKERIAKVLG